MAWRTGILRAALLLSMTGVSPHVVSAASPPGKEDDLDRSADDRRPDFSDVTSARRAGVLVRQGRLVRTLLFPAELGGQDVKENRIYLPPAVEDTRQLLIGTLVRFRREGLVDRMEVHADYRGASIVPTRITMRATHSSKKGEFTPTLEVW